MLIVLVIITGCTPVPDLSFAEKVTVYYTHVQKEDLTVEITDSDDVNDLIRAFTEENESGSGNCIFTELKLVFEGDDKTLSLHPTTDGCPTVFYRKNSDHYYFMSNENKKVLYGILEEYEVPLYYELLYSQLEKSK